MAINDNDNIQKMQANAFAGNLVQPPKVCPTCGTCPTCGQRHPQTGFMPSWPYPQTVIWSSGGTDQSAGGSLPQHLVNIN